MFWIPCIDCGQHYTNYVQGVQEYNDEDKAR